ncbi:MAG: cytochrome c [Candidatus Lustribacter sp.]|jgi:cytochrome c553
MKRAGFALAVALVTIAAAPHAVKPVSVSLPAATVAFNDGPNVETARAYCLTCHSAEYVYMQPPLARPAWTAEVVKMRNAYGASIPDSATDAIVDYLLSQNGPK